MCLCSSTYADHKSLHVMHGKVDTLMLSLRFLSFIDYTTLVSCAFSLEFDRVYGGT